MNTIKRINLLLVLSLGVQLAHANVTPKDINTLGKINAADHKMEQPQLPPVELLLASSGCALFEGLLTAAVVGGLAEQFAGNQYLRAGAVAGMILGTAHGVSWLVVPELKEYKTDKRLFKSYEGADVWAVAAQNNAQALQDFYTSGYKNMNAQDLRGRTPLMYAAAHGSKEAVDTLLKIAAPMRYSFPSVDLQDMHGRTAAHYAALNNHPEILKTLVKEYAADLKIADRDGKTVRDLISQNPTLREALNEKK